MRKLSILLFGGLISLGIIGCNSTDARRDFNIMGGGASPITVGREAKAFADKSFADSKDLSQKLAKANELAKTVDNFIATFVSATNKDKAKAYADLRSLEGQVSEYRLMLGELGLSSDVYDKYDLIHSERAESIIREISELDNDDSSVSELPEKPVNDPPKYEGAYYLAGFLRRCYKDGVVLESGDQLYFGKGFNCPDLVFDMPLVGYVEDTGDTVNVDFGRSGREAKVVTLSDKETARDDRKSYRESLVSYQAEYIKAVQDYQLAVSHQTNKKSENAKRRIKLNKEFNIIMHDLVEAVKNSK